MTDLDVFLPDILPYVAGCPEPVAFQKIIRAAQEFCERTRLWREESTIVLAQDYDSLVVVPDGADLFEIESAYVDGCALDPIALADLDRKHERWRELDAGQGRWITQTSPGSVIIVPRCAGSLRLSLFLRPSDGVEMLPDFIVRLYRQCIADGALAEILMIPGKSFSDPSRAQFYSMRFENKLADFSSRTIKGQQRAPIRARAQFL